MKQVTKFLDWGIKISSLAVTGPATWNIAALLFHRIQNPTLLFFVQSFAVFLVEGVLLTNWILLQFDKDALPEIKARYGISALVMYVAVLIIAWADEGPVGLVFRLALLVALVGSGWDTYVATWNSIARRTDKSIENSPKVRKEIRKLSTDLAIQKANAEFAVQSKMIEVQVGTQTKRIALAGVRDDTLGEEIHQKELTAGLESVKSVNFTGLQSGLQPVQVQPVESTLLITSKAAPDDLDKRIVEIYNEFPGLSYRKAAELLGVTQTTVANHVKDLEIFGLLKKEDGKVYPVLEEAPALPPVVEDQPVQEPQLVPVPPTADPVVEPDETTSRFQSQSGEF